MSAWRKKAIDIIDGLIANNDIHNVFEVGCDDAGISRKLAEKYPTIQFSGVDFRSDKIDIANELKNKHSLQNVKFTYDYFLNIKDIDQHYDVVIFTEVYEHLIAENQIYALRLLGNFMSKNGFLVFTCPNGDYLLSYLETKKDFNSRYGIDFFDNIYQTEHWLEPSHKEIIKIFVSLGFDIIDCGYFNLPKRQFLIIEKLEAIFNKVPVFRSLFFKSQFIVTQKNLNSPLLKTLNFFDN
jgi:hypothetical protein